MPIGLELDGEPVEEVSVGYNKQIVTGLQREKPGLDRVGLSDWKLEILEAGMDRFDGEESTDLWLGLPADGHVREARIDESVRRLLLLKFLLGLFATPTWTRTPRRRSSATAGFRREGHVA